MEKRKLTSEITYFGSMIFSFYAVGGGRPALLELGISQLAPLVAREFVSIAGRPPASLIALHSHYDHAGGAGRLMSIFPSAVLAASAAGAAALADPATAETARRAMLAVNSNPLFAKTYPDADQTVVSDPVQAGLILSHGDTIDTGGGGDLEVIATPGHSPCSISLFHRRSGALFVSDACGMPLPSGRIWPTAFDNAEQYIASLRLMLELAPRFVCPGHYLFFRENRAKRFLEKSIAATEIFFEKLNGLADRLGSDEPAILAALHELYDEDVVFIQENVLRHGHRVMTRQVIAKGNDSPG